MTESGGSPSREAAAAVTDSRPRPLPNLGALDSTQAQQDLLAILVRQDDPVVTEVQHHAGDFFAIAAQHHTAALLAALAQQLLEPGYVAFLDHVAHPPLAATSGSTRRRCRRLRRYRGRQDEGSDQERAADGQNHCGSPVAGTGSARSSHTRWWSDAFAHSTCSGGEIGQNTPPPAWV